MPTNQRFIVAVSGASGVIYGVRLLKALLSAPREVYAMVSDAGKQVLAHEMAYDGESFEDFLKKNSVKVHKNAKLTVYESSNLFAPPASGSFKNNGMVIAPCSMKTLGAIASGISDTLIHRSADVALKEKRPLILLTRETPLNSIHLRNMYQASLAGATIMPLCPGFYFHPNTVIELVDSVIGRVLDQLNISHHLTREWSGR